jgi:hypothetical protein
MPGYDINGNIITSPTINYDGFGVKHNFGDGSSSSNPAKSGWDLKLNYPSKPSGFYWIKSEIMPNAISMYVDMVEEGGGYDFHFITGGPSVNNVFSTNGGTALGLDLVMPRSKFHWRAMSNAVNGFRPAGSYNDYFQTVYGVYSPTPGNYTNVIMRSNWYAPPNAPAAASTAHRVKDGGRWWLRDNTFSEPNGDYGANGLFGGYTQPQFPYGLGDLQFNDITANYFTGNFYLVSTNAKP